MKWKEFATYLGGLDGSTPLGRIVAIRSEDDPKKVKEMTPEQKRVRTEWRRRRFDKNPPKDATSVYLDLQRAMQSLAGYEKS